MLTTLLLGILSVMGKSFTTYNRYIYSLTIMKALIHNLHLRQRLRPEDQQLRPQLQVPDRPLGSRRPRRSLR
jgi:hypothetical protein